MCELMHKSPTGKFGESCGVCDKGTAVVANIATGRSTGTAAWGMFE